MSRGLNRLSDGILRTKVHNRSGSLWSLTTGTAVPSHISPPSGDYFVTLPFDPARTVQHPSDVDVPGPEGPGSPNPLQVPAAAAARLAGVSKATWHRLHAAAKVPAPNRLGGRVLWRLDELHAWIQAGCPDRTTWATLRAARRR
jgi:predicted DNA-binding transcriptional regulator AlpA